MVIRPRVGFLSRYLKSRCLHPTDIHYALRIRNCSHLGYIHKEARTFRTKDRLGRSCFFIAYVLGVWESEVMMAHLSSLSIPFLG